MPIQRRTLLRGLLAAPLVCNAEFLMPVRSLAMEPSFMAGDLVDFSPKVWKLFGISARCEVVKRIEGRFLITTAPSFKTPPEEIRVPKEYVTLYEGLPGNRVNNPSTRHRLIRSPVGIGYCYPEDMTKEPK